MDSTEGRFVYFIGFDDLIPLSASFSSKELNIEKVLSEKKKDKKSESGEGKKDKKDESGHKSLVSEGHQDKENVDTKKDDQEMGKKEAAREYSKHMMAQVKKRIKVINVWAGLRYNKEGIWLVLWIWDFETSLTFLNEDREWGGQSLEPKKGKRYSKIN